MVDQTKDIKKDSAKSDDSKKEDAKAESKKEPEKKDSTKTDDSKPKTLDEAASALESALKKSNESKSSSDEKITSIAAGTVGVSKKTTEKETSKSEDKSSNQTDSAKSDSNADAAKSDDKHSDASKNSSSDNADDKDNSSEKADSDPDYVTEKPKRHMPSKLKQFLLGFAVAIFIIVVFFGALWFIRLPSMSDTVAIDKVALPDEVTFLSDSQTMDLTKLAPADAVDVAMNYQANMQACSELLLSDDKNWTSEQVDELQDAFPNTKVKGTITAFEWSADFIDEFAKRNPDMKIIGTLQIGGVKAPLGDSELDLTGMNTAAMSELEKALPYFENLEKINFGTDENGYTGLKDVSEFTTAHPEFKVKYHFTVWGKKVSLHAKKLDLNHIQMDDQGKQVRDVLPYMPDVTFLDMDFCDVDNEHMAAIRDDFPDIKVVWRIWFGSYYSVRTDVEKILASAPLNGGMLNPENTVALKYCTDLKYLDIGHNDDLQDISFISYMPNLEVLIIMWGHITDISPIADCPKMEFLEIFTNNITDLTPLEDLKEIKHLNICNNPNMDDITPLYGLSTLERLWIGRANRIPPEQVEKFMELNPDCDVKFVPCDPHDGWRWGVPRYEVLRETFGYATADYQTINNDPLYYPHPNDDEEEEDNDDD